MSTYDTPIMSIELSADEVDVLRELLENNMDDAFGIGERHVYEGLLDKLEE